MTILLRSWTLASGVGPTRLNERRAEKCDILHLAACQRWPHLALQIHSLQAKLTSWPWVLQDLEGYFCCAAACLA